MFDTHAHTHMYLLLLSTSSAYLPVVFRQGEGMICNCDMLDRKLPELQLWTHNSSVTASLATLCERCNNHHT